MSSESELRQKRLVLRDLEEENEDSGGVLTQNILTSRSKVEFDQTYQSVQYEIDTLSKREGINII